MATAGSASSSPHVALLAFPFASHPNTLHALATLLASAAPHAYFSFFSSARTNAHLANLPSPRNLSLYPVSDGCEELLAADGDVVIKVLVLYLEACPANYVEGMRGAVGDRGGVPISCVVCDCLLVPLLAGVAEEMGAPLVAFRTGGTGAFSSNVYTDEIRLKVGVGERVVDQKLDFIPSLAAFQVSDLPEGVVDGDPNFPFFQLLRRMGLEISRSVAALALNTCPSLEGPIVADLSTKFSRCLPVGPLNLLLPRHQPHADASDSRCLPWLDEQQPFSVAYIAFGTVVSLKEPELTSVAEALESTSFSFLWALKQEAQVLLPRGFLDRTAGRGMVVGWAPQAELLQHASVGVFVTHCGWKSVMESVAGGVPMVCRPEFGDQRMNARQVVDVWRVGVRVEGGPMTRETVAAALERVLGMEDGTAMRERVRLLGEQAREATSEGGSSRKSLEELAEVVCYKSHAAV